MGERIPLRPLLIRKLGHLALKRLCGNRLGSE